MVSWFDAELIWLSGVTNTGVWRYALRADHRGIVYRRCLGRRRGRIGRSVGLALGSWLDVSRVEVIPRLCRLRLRGALPFLGGSRMGL
jgi:hypothetical protein